MSIAVRYYCQLDAYLHFVSKLLLDAIAEDGRRRRVTVS